ncbi:MAG: SpoVG family protein [Clostridia bacterium]|nr:SpoVG family protein [Clostridia bacterium]
MATKKSNSKKQSNTKNKVTIPSIKARIDELTDYGEESRLRAYASLTVGGSFAVHGLRVYEGENGMFVAMPSRKVGEEYIDTFHAITKEGFDKIQKAVVSAYDQAVKQAEENTQNEDGQTENEETSQVENQNLGPSM